MRRAIIAGNWKMHGTRQSVVSLLDEIKTQYKELQCDLIIFPSFVFLECVESLLADTDIMWGGQNCHPARQGAFTGEISADMLVDLGCRYVLVGHSERRQLFQESNEWVATKFLAAQAAGLVPVLCVGETAIQREQGYTHQVIRAQLNAILQKIEIESLARAVIAYEPVWAIGTGNTATPEQAQSVHASIRHTLAQFSEEIAQGMRILYGGSVKPDNAADLFQQPDIDGALVGGASLRADDFIQIAKSYR